MASRSDEHGASGTAQHAPAAELVGDRYDPMDIEDNEAGQQDEDGIQQGEVARVDRKGKGKMTAVDPPDVDNVSHEPLSASIPIDSRTGHGDQRG